MTEWIELIKWLAEGIFILILVWLFFKYMW